MSSSIAMTNDELTSLQKNLIKGSAEEDFVSRGRGVCEGSTIANCLDEHFFTCISPASPGHSIRLNRPLPTPPYSSSSFLCFVPPLLVYLA